MKLTILIIISVWSWCLAELKSGLIIFEWPLIDQSISLDFSELVDDSRYHASGLDTLVVEADFIFSSDSASAPYGMQVLPVTDTLVSFDEVNFDSLAALCDSAVTSDTTMIGGDTVFTNPNQYPLVYSFKIVTQEGQLAWFKFINVWYGGLDHYTYYWAYDDSEISTSVRGLPSQKQKAVFLPGRFKGRNIKGQVSTR